MKKLTLRRLKNTSFRELYFKILFGEDISREEITKFLTLAILFLDSENEDIKSLGYRLLLFYSNITQDYKPLYEYAENEGLIPISNFISNILGYHDKFGNIQTEINDIQNDEYNINGYYRTIAQKKLIEFSDGILESSQIIVAPTSYGKTELITNTLTNYKGKNMCILTPNKSLLSQTKKRMLNDLGYHKIITYPEMYDEKDSSIIAVFTQERLSRFYSLFPKIGFDMLVVDEAHNLMETVSVKDYRSMLLATVVIQSEMRNNDITMQFLTPFVENTENLKLKYSETKFETHKVKENIKSELYFFHEIENHKKYFYDQYLNEFIDLESDYPGEDKLIDSEIILRESTSKNIVYLNSPRKIESFSKELARILPTVDSEIISKASQDLKEYLHPEYNLAKMIERGIIYHHGAVPEAVRLYIEELYCLYPEFKYLVSNATLMEGVNVPALKLFILDPNKGRSRLSAASFKNLIGRVCRFNEIFHSDTGDLSLLMPEIHMIKGNYCASDFSKYSFVRNVKIWVEKDITDNVENPLLKNNHCSENQIEIAEEFLANKIEKEKINKLNVRKVSTEFGQLCFENNITSFDIFEKELEINNRIIEKNYNISTIEEIFEVMNETFFVNVNEESHGELYRLINRKARNFYVMITNWRINGDDMSKMIQKMIDYWETLEVTDLVYIGRWGDQVRDGFRKFWTYINQKTYSEKVNLAIVRLKEEFDFLDYEIIKYIEVLYSLGIVTDDIYLKFKYGTSDPNRIKMLNYGLSSKLIEVLEKNYKESYHIDENDNVVIERNIFENMRKDKVNGVLITEMKMNFPD